MNLICISGTDLCNTYIFKGKFVTMANPRVWQKQSKENTRVHVCETLIQSLFCTILEILVMKGIEIYDVPRLKFKFILLMI